ncbi:hypothetical protein Tco_1542672, partial [Tanacetum coccineum]
MDQWGDHAVHCCSEVGVKFRHNPVRDILVDICSKVGIMVRKEAPMGFLSEDRKDLRPADLLLFNWLQGKDACLDVTCISPFASMGATACAPEAALHNAVEKKKKKYGSVCEKNRYKFIPFAFSTFREFDTDALDTLSRIKSIFISHSNNVKSGVFIFHRTLIHYTAAVRVLSSSGVAPYNDATLQELKTKHPFKSAPSLPDTPIDHPHLIVSRTAVLDRIKSFPRGTSCGRDGLRAQHLLDCLSGAAVAVSDELVSSITQVVNLFLEGKCPTILGEYIASAPLTPLVKPGGGIRLIAVGTIWRRLVSKVGATMIGHSLDGY